MIGEFCDSQGLCPDQMLSSRLPHHLVIVSAQPRANCFPDVDHRLGGITSKGFQLHRMKSAKKSGNEFPTGITTGWHLMVAGMQTVI